MTREHHVDSVAPGETLIAQGGSAYIGVTGDVGEDAVLIAQGGSAKIEVGGYVHAGAQLTAQGGGAEIILRGGAHPSVQPVAQGGGARVTIKRGKPTAQGLLPPIPPRPPKPPKPPKPPRPSQFQSSGVHSVSFSARGSIGDLTIADGQVWIDGKPIMDKALRPTDVPPSEPKGTLTIQKSHRPREQWGT